MHAVKEGFGVLKATFKEFSNDDCPSMAAALAYYTIFSLPPLLVLLIAIAGGLWPESGAVQANLMEQIGATIGPEGAAQVRTMIENANATLAASGGWIAYVLGIGALLFGATGAFVQLQSALNRAWEVTPDPEGGGLKVFVFKRLLSFGMILGVAFLLLVSLVVSAAISVVLQQAQRLLPEGFSGPLLWVVNETIALAIVSLLFGAMFKLLPDAEIGWRDVLPGAVFTGVLFTAGKFLLSFYLGQSNPGNAFGAAGSLALILVWIYYSAMILLIGAEFTQVWMQRSGRQIQPSRGAVRVVHEQRCVRDTDAASGDAASGDAASEDDGHTPHLPEPHNRVDRVYKRRAP